MSDYSYFEIRFMLFKHQMWRQTTFLGEKDSDQSISDEEDFDIDLRDNCVPLDVNSEKEEAVQLQSRLNILKGTLGENCRTACNLSPEKPTSVPFEDEVEVPDFPNEGSFIFSPRKASTCNSDDEVISDYEENVLKKFSVTPTVKIFCKDGVHDVGSGNLGGENTWSGVSKEADMLICLNENAFCSSSSHSASKVKTSGIRSKSRPNFSFRFQSSRELSSSYISKNENCIPSKAPEVPERLETINCRKHSIGNLLEEFCGEKAKKSEIVPDEGDNLHRRRHHSVVELLDGLQDNSSLLRQNSKMHSRTRGKKKQVASKRGVMSLGDRTIDNEDLLEPKGSRSSSDDEANSQNLKLGLPEMKRQTIGDRFQEALGATSSDKAALVALPRASGFGLFGKLQRVMQREKYIDMEFLKLENRDEPSCIDVKILSRYLDAKLIVCHVSSDKDIEGPQWPASNQKIVRGGRERIIIFNPRVCCDVDLEVGNSIRIHWPWKEVLVRGNNKSILLSTYFSQIST